MENHGRVTPGLLGGGVGFAGLWAGTGLAMGHRRTCSGTCSSPASNPARSLGWLMLAFKQTFRYFSPEIFNILTLKYIKCKFSKLITQKENLSAIKTNLCNLPSLQSRGAHSPACVILTTEPQRQARRSPQQRPGRPTIHGVTWLISFFPKNYSVLFAAG